MKKHVIVPFGICLLLIMLSGYFIYTRYTAQIEAKKDLMVLYMSGTKTQMKAILANVKELPHIVKPIVDQGMLAKDLARHAESISQLEKLYVDNRVFFKGISIYDMQGQAFNLFREKKGGFIQDTYTPRDINVLRSEMGISIEKRTLSVILPVFQNGALSGNVVASIDLDSLQHELFKPYMEKGDVWPSTILDESTCISLPFDEEIVLSDEKDIIKGVQERKSGFFTGKIKGHDLSASVITYYESLPVSEYYLGIAFNSNISPLIFSSLLIFGLISVLLIALAFAVAITLNRLITHNRDAIEKKDQYVNFIQTMFRNLPVGVFVRQRNRLYTANNTFFQMLNKYVSVDDTGKRMDELLMPSAFSDLGEQEELKEWEMYTIESNGQEINLARQQMQLELNGEKYTIDALWNVTELEHRRKDAVRSEIAKSELLSRISADFSKSLNNIRNAVVILTQQYPEEQHVSLIKELTDDLSDVVADVQDFADIEAGRIVLDEMPFNIVDELKKATDEFHAETQEKGIDLQVHIASSAMRTLVGDPQRIRQILSELLSNAVKFTQKGTIRILLETTELQNRKVLVKCSVEDTGQGMPKQKLKNLFSLDLRAKEEGDGLGLGIIIVRKLVNIMGGNLRATSPSPISTSPDTPGMQFSFTFQCYSDQPFSKNIDYSSLVSYSQVNFLLITSNPHQMQDLVNFLNRKKIHSDVFLYNKDSSELLINKLIIDKGRYQVVVIATANSEINFAIASDVNQNDLTEDCLYVMVDSFSQRGNYVKAKSLCMDYYFVKHEDLSIYDSILKTHFNNLSESNDGLEHNFLRKDLNILIAENNSLSQTVAKVIFKQLGYEVDFAQNALHLINQMNHKAYDIIFIDLKFPPNNGFEIAEVLRQKEYKMPVIAMTSTLTKENIKNIFDSGMDGYVPKPLNPDSIKNTLFKWFA